MTNLEFYTVQEVAEIMKVTKETVRTWIHDKELPAFKAGRSWRVPKEELRNFVSHRFGGGTPVPQSQESTDG